ncbi:MAG: type III pantothenate kinase [Spirochaetes bacterium]|nr:type III pantothenate kinase [Spirochaetota bacterium]MBU0955605.1 type III pantothenate kinase [Spirochaetota bacterium]
MLLAVDARNSTVSIGIKNADSWLSVVRISPDRTADEYALLMQSAAERIPGIHISRAFIASVVPALTPRLIQAVQAAFGKEARQIGPGIKTGLRIRTDVPSELGADIVCSAVAVRQRNSGASLVADFATAISISAINSQGELLGVAIAPGMEAAIKGLRNATAQLADVPLEAPPAYIGRTTSRSLQSGLFLGYTGLVHHLLAGMRRELSEPVQVYGTGHEYGRIILDGFKDPDVSVCKFVPDLALEGLSFIADLNS